MKFDLAKTAELDRLFGVAPEARDDAWREAFFAAVPDASLATGPEQVLRGPDGFPYLTLALPAPATEFDAYCLTHVLDACLEQGFGIVVQGRGEQPEWVFSYGDLWSFKATGRFALPAEGATEVPAGQQAMVGSPSEELLPPYARAALRKELQAQGATDPGVLVVMIPGMVPERSLAFVPMPDPRRLLWYLPRDLGLVDAPPGSPEPMPL